MKHSINQLLSYSIILNCLILCSCITEYVAKNIDEVADVLVVEGIITDDESVITLSKSVSITGGGFYDFPISIANANVYVECDDGTKTESGFYEPPDTLTGQHAYRVGRYTIKTGLLNLERKYRLKIEFDNHEYVSDFSYPIKTPEIDSVFWMKKGLGQPVDILVATHSPIYEVLYYRWFFKEEWETHSVYKVTRCPVCEKHVLIYYDRHFCPRCGAEMEPYPYYCWNLRRVISFASSDRTVFGRVTDIITKIDPTDRRLSVLYRVVVNQNAISKRAHDYYVNIRKNSENIGSIFAPTPSELRGNMVCTTDPRRPVIGYIEVSHTTQKTLYISESDGVYEDIPRTCFSVNIDEVSYRFVDGIGWIYLFCIDCALHNFNLSQKPDDWP